MKGEQHGRQGDAQHKGGPTEKTVRQKVGNIAEYKRLIGTGENVLENNRETWGRKSDEEGRGGARGPRSEGV